MSIEKLISSLAEREPHLKNALSELSISQIDDRDFACAAISIAEDRVTLILNKRKFDTLFSEEKIAVLAHEFGHMALGHLSNRSFPEHNRFIVSLAQDLPLNAGLAQAYKLPEWFVTANKLGLPEGLSTSQYIPILDSIGVKKLSKLVKIPSIELDINIKKNQMVVKSVVDKIRLNPHLVISKHTDNAGGGNIY
jgi:hypothetical protein